MKGNQNWRTKKKIEKRFRMWIKNEIENAAVGLQKCQVEKQIFFF